ncbi:hypothetical protein [Nonomuraea sp. NPDC049695]|uniref:hypothetical protein n=1 Tax=Nonomuraea sp. NPDC049695 TaxID=3154734 RepID=UPI003449F453
MGRIRSDAVSLPSALPPVRPSLPVHRGRPPPPRPRLGHASAETTQLYALLDDKAADAEVRAARRRRERSAR